MKISWVNKLRKIFSFFSIIKEKFLALPNFFYFYFCQEHLWLFGDKINGSYFMFGGL